MDIKKIEEIQSAIIRHQEAKQPAGHNIEDEDISKIASTYVIGKTVAQDPFPNDKNSDLNK